MGNHQSKRTKHGTFECQLDDWAWVWAIRDGSYLDWKLECQSDDEIQAQAVKQHRMPVAINHDIFLGNAASIQNVSNLQKLGITAVLNMAGPMALPSKTIRELKRHDISYKRITADDEVDYPILEEHWDEARRFISSSTKNGNKCVIHCVAGMNRSAIIVAAYYMLQEQVPVLDTVKHIRKERGNVALQNEGFQEQLVALARRHGLLGARPGTSESFVKSVPPSVQNDWRVSARTAQARPRSNPLDRLSESV